ncbi:acyl-CoA N-acyltransferase [Fusarium solani]|uniref:Acyl-CoA N-acyltransferase n=1 Tax=Fusarium solani TaxID=169388 RepID=A0A9P9G8R3_FUSSL|nr:acyl-CoA N-acyltransferase [Fusarium solani]KAH7234441.1 acyl-CoA N-acyltransferase [Fusarium solani]
MNSLDEIRTSRLLLRRLRSNRDGSQDLEWYHTVWSDDQATQWSPHGPCKTKEDSRDWMAGIIPQSTQDNGIRIGYAVFCQRSSEPGMIEADEDWEIAGVITLLAPTHGGSEDTATSEPQINRRPIDIGYLFLPFAWGRGLATESLEKLLELYQAELAATEKDIHVDLYAYVHLKNAPSARVVQKLGFEEIKRFEKKVWLPLIQGPSQEVIVEFHKSLC